MTTDNVINNNILYNTGIVPLPPRAYWKDYKHDYPVLSCLARDLLSMPATGAGVE